MYVNNVDIACSTSVDNGACLINHIKKTHIFMEPKGSLPYSQLPATCPYPEPTLSSPHNSIQLPKGPS
jgi:hypothetical protein